MARLKSAVALITGASSGIGEAIARLFAAEGASVMVLHHGHADDAKAIVDDIINAGGIAQQFHADVRDEGDIARVFQAARTTFGEPTILVNSAGVDAVGINVADMELAQFENVLRTNLIGPFLFARAFIRGALAAKVRGRIINISSVHEEIPRAGAADYCASKGGLRNLTRCLALELAEHGITVNGIAPGMILTPMNQEAIDDPAKLKRQVESIPMKRAGKPEEVAELALYLASAAGSYASGATFTLDGALSMNLGQGG